MKPGFSLSLFLFTTLKLVAGQDDILTEYDKLKDLCNKGGAKTVSCNLVKCTTFRSMKLLFSMLGSGTPETTTLPTTMEIAIRIQSTTVNWLRWPYSANP